MFGWKWEELEQVMDWITVAGVITAFVLLVIEIIRGINEKKALSKEHDGLSKEHNGLSKEHDGLKEFLSNEHSLLKDNSNLILGKVTSLDKFMAVEAAKRELTDNNLTNNQRDIKQQIHAIDRMLQEMEQLQSKVVDLEQENRSLRERVEKFSRQQQTKRERKFDTEQEL